MNNEEKNLKWMLGYNFRFSMILNCINNLRQNDDVIIQMIHLIIKILSKKFIFL